MLRAGRLRSFLALLLVFLASGETTDLLPCGESDCSAWLVLLDIHDPSSGAEEDRSSDVAGVPGAPDDCCLCHVSFTSEVSAEVPVPHDVLLAPIAVPRVFAIASIAVVPTPPPRA